MAQEDENIFKAIEEIGNKKQKKEKKSRNIFKIKKDLSFSLALHSFCINSGIISLLLIILMLVL